MRSYQSQNRSKDYCFCVFEELNVKSVNNFNFCVRLLSSVGFLCLLLATDTARAQSRYVLTDLGTLGGENRATCPRNQQSGRGSRPSRCPRQHVFFSRLSL